MASLSSIYFKVGVLVAAFVCLIYLADAEAIAKPNIGRFVEGFARRKRSCQNPSDVDKNAAWDCRVPHARSGSNNCCSGYTCKCGIELSYYITTASSCRCVDW